MSHAVLTISDWIAIIAASLQIAVAIGIGIWQVRLAQRLKATLENPEPKLGTFDWKWFLRQSWQFILCAIVAVALLWQTLSSSQTVTKGLVLEAVIYSFMLVFGAT